MNLFSHSWAVLHLEYIKKWHRVSQLIWSKGSFCCPSPVSKDPGQGFLVPLDTQDSCCCFMTGSPSLSLKVRCKIEVWGSLLGCTQMHKANHFSGH